MTKIYDEAQTIVRFKLLHENVKAPTRGHPGDAGWDLYLPESVTLAPGLPEKVPLGIAVQLPSGWEMQIRPRSSASKMGLHVAFGTVDSGYRGELALIVTKMNDNRITLDAGSRIAQAVIAPIYSVHWLRVDELDLSTRGQSGFGSTGR